MHQTVEIITNVITYTPATNNVLLQEKNTLVVKLYYFIILSNRNYLDINLRMFTLLNLSTTIHVHEEKRTQGFYINACMYACNILIKNFETKNKGFHFNI